MARHRCPGYLCERCRHRLAELLNPSTGADAPAPSLPALYGRLSPVKGQGGTGDQGHAKPGPRSPADDEALSLTDPRTDPYRALILAYTEMRGEYPPPSFRFLCAWLWAVVDEIAVLPWAGQFLGHLERPYNRMRQAAGVAIPAKIGTCQCGNALYASGSPVLECSQCQTTYDATASISAALREAQ